MWEFQWTENCRAFAILPASTGFPFLHGRLATRMGLSGLKLSVLVRKHWHREVVHFFEGRSNHPKRNTVALCWLSLDFWLQSSDSNPSHFLRRNDRTTENAFVLVFRAGDSCKVSTNLAGSGRIPQGKRTKKSRQKMRTFVHVVQKEGTAPRYSLWEKLGQKSGIPFREKNIKGEKSFQKSNSWTFGDTVIRSQRNKPKVIQDKKLSSATGCGIQACCGFPAPKFCFSLRGQVEPPFASNDLKSCKKLRPRKLFFRSETEKHRPTQQCEFLLYVH